MSEPQGSLETNNHTEQKLDEAAMQEAFTKVRDFMARLPSLKTATDLDDAIRQLREVFSNELGAADFFISDLKKRREFVASMYWSWVFRFAEHTIDPHYEVDSLIQALERLKSKLPKGNEVLYRRANRLRAEGKRWLDVCPCVIRGWSSMDGAARKLASDDFRKANNQFNSRLKIAVKPNDPKRKGR